MSVNGVTDQHDIGNIFFQDGFSLAQEHLAENRKVMAYSMNGCQEMIIYANTKTDPDHFIRVTEEAGFSFGFQGIIAEVLFM